MRIAIIGGGAAGLSTAYYLAKGGDHELVLFEKQATLGGNVRTLGRNTEGLAQLEKLNIDNGVIEFPARDNPQLSSLLAELGIDTEIIRGGSTSFFTDGPVSFHMPSAIGRMHGVFGKIAKYCRLLQAAITFLPVLVHLRKADPERPLSDYFGGDPMSLWLQGLLMYAYSMPFETISRFPTGFALETLTRMARDGSWMRIPGGVYRYMEVILDSIELDVRCDSSDLKLRRDHDQVTVTQGSQTDHFDVAVLAIPPHEVLGVLDDPDQGEVRCFENWRQNTATTLIHTDTSLYEGWSPPEYTEFDIFEKTDGRDAGYNAYLNRLVGVSTEKPPHYFLAYNLEDRIDAGQVLHRWTHNTAYFEAGADTRREILALNGTNGIYYAGAYLYDGLHEGAITSGVQVAKLIAARASDLS